MEAVFIVLFVVFCISIEENRVNVFCCIFERVNIGIIIICNVSMLSLLCIFVNDIVIIVITHVKSALDQGEQA